NEAEGYDFGAGEVLAQQKDASEQMHRRRDVLNQAQRAEAQDACADGEQNERHQRDDAGPEQQRIGGEVQTQKCGAAVDVKPPQPDQGKGQDQQGLGQQAGAAVDLDLLANQAIGAETAG